MLQSSETESEILLGNKQLLGIFLVVAVLLGVSFVGGFLIGKGSLGRKLASSDAASYTGATSAAFSSSATSPGAGGQTHTLEGDTDLPAAASGGADREAAGPSSRTVDSRDEPDTVLGAHKRTAGASPPSTKHAVPEPASKSNDVESDYSPHSGTEYLQVAAVGRDEAEAVADVLHKKGFRAHAVPKPGNAKLYRVIIGPVKDAGELSSTRDALRKTGFREVIVQRY